MEVRKDSVKGVWQMPRLSLKEILLYPAKSRDKQDPFHAERAVSTETQRLKKAWCGQGAPEVLGGKSP